MSWWTSREPREKVLIAIAVALIAVLLGWQFVAKPVYAYPNSQQKIYQNAQSDLDIMNSGAQALKATRSLPKTALSLNRMQQVITKSAAKKGLEISRRQPNGERGVSLWFENASSTQIYDWLGELTTMYNIAVLRVSINRNDDGTVRAQITFLLDTV